MQLVTFIFAGILLSIYDSPLGTLTFGTEAFPVETYFFFLTKLATFQIF